MRISSAQASTFVGDTLAAVIEGRFDLRAVPAGHHRLEAQCDDGGEVTTDLDVADHDSQVELVADAVCEIRVGVLSPSGISVSGVVVTLSPLSPRSWNARAKTTRTTSAGAFGFRDVLAGVYDVAASPVTHPEDYSEPVRIEVAGCPGSRPIPLLLRAPLAASLKGHLRFEDDTPVDGLLVQLATQKGGASEPTRSDGYFEFRGLRAGGYELEVFDSEVGALEIAGGKPSVNVSEANTNHLDVILLRPIGRIRGRVVNSRGQPVGFAMVSAERLSLSGASGNGFYALGTRVSHLSKADGVFEMYGLPPGAYRLRARSSEGDSIPLQAQTGDDITLRVVPLLGLNGVVEESDGAVLKSFAIELSDTTGFRRSQAFRSEEGRFSISELAPGDYDVLISSDKGKGWDRVTIDEGTGAEQLRIRLPRQVVLSGRTVESPGGLPLDGLPVAALCGGNDDEPTDSRYRTAVTDVQGRFTMHIPAGEPCSLLAPSLEIGDVGYRRLERYMPPVERSRIELGTLEIIRQRHPPSAMGYGFSLAWPPRSVADELIWTVDTVDPAGPASTVGVTSGEVIARINGVAIEEMLSERVLQTLEPVAGDVVELTFMSGRVVKLEAGP